MLRAIQAALIQLFPSPADCFHSVAALTSAWSAVCFRPDSVEHSSSVLGFAVVEMECEDDAQAAMLMLNGSIHLGTRLTVRPATAREETAAGRPRFFGTMNMVGDSTPPTDV
jgi:hypothetical protein